MKSPRILALTLVLLVQGVVLIAGAVLSLFASSLFPVDKAVGADSSAAAVALGVGLAAAAFRPMAHVTWIRIQIIYAFAAVVWSLIEAGFLAVPFQFTPLVVGVVCSVLLVAFHPDRKVLIPTLAASTGAPSGRTA